MNIYKKLDKTPNQTLLQFSKNGKYKRETNLEAQEIPINDGIYKSKETKMVIGELVEKNEP